MEALFIGACSESPHQSRPRRRPAHIKRKRSLEFLFKMGKKCHLNWIAARDARMENEPVYYDRSLYSSTSGQSTTSSTSSTTSSSTSSSEPSFWTLKEQTRTKTSSASIGSNATIKRTSFPWTTTRTNKNSDLNDDYHSTSSHGNDSSKGTTVHFSSTDERKLAAPGFDGAGLILAHVGLGFMRKLLPGGGAEADEPDIANINQVNNQASGADSSELEDICSFF